MNPFDVLNSINYTKKNLIDDGVCEEKQYLPFIINKGLSYFPDTLFHANEINFRNFLPKKLQYDYLLLSVRKRKRFSKWLKNVEPVGIKCVARYYNISSRRAEEYIKLLSKTQLKVITDMYKDIDGD